MEKTIPTIPELCDHVKITENSKHNQLPDIVKKMLSGWSTKECFDHISPVCIPSQEKIIDIALQARRIIFPGYFTTTKLHASNIEYYIGKETMDLYELVCEQITMAIRHDCRRNRRLCTNCEQESAKLALQFMEKLPEITATLAQDIRATLAGDPATKSPDEVIFCYPGLLATLVYRLAHELFLLEVPFVPRIMTEYAHSQTGIDIHPGAQIAPGFFIDHGTGIVIGETTIIGENVRIYQGVTLGALSLPRDAGEKLRSTKRHPTIENDVIIYANTTILGGTTTIGEGSVIGGNSWIIESVEQGSKVFLKKPELIVHHANGQKTHL
ncbi:serine O-acetyltransferase [Desulfotalea psychrophila]|uniref:Related to serine acetyltransferase n=1 Tax=Desulfotalea psychrophila (strain LSv54 / DSM 12343) TaxID=177439 RepID=Q6ANV4_DESPS|nr:serine acetyltransferase [Desulfotalea psychrophila]CAG35970.1 related to serine acetyltransferase [Desulfotalea psychrophila LSv54]